MGDTKEELLKPLLTDEFLETLLVAARTCGWSVDLIEISSFVGWCYELAGKDEPDTQEYLDD